MNTHRIKSIFSFFLIISLSLSAIAQQGGRKSFGELMQAADRLRHEADQLVESGKNQEAVDNYKLALEHYQVVKANFPDIDGSRIAFGINLCQYQLSQIQIRDGVAPHVTETVSREISVLPGITARYLHWYPPKPLVKFDLLAESLAEIEVCMMDRSGTGWWQAAITTMRCWSPIRSR